MLTRKQVALKKNHGVSPPGGCCALLHSKVAPSSSEEEGWVSKGGPLLVKRDKLMAL